MSTTSLREEISDLRSYIDGLPEDIRNGPYGEIYKERLEILLREVAEAELVEATRSTMSPAMDVRLQSGDKLLGQIKATLLGELLQTWQTLISALGQAAAGMATARGVIQGDIVERTTLNAVAFAPGSFVVRLVFEPQEQGELPGLGVRAFYEFESLLGAGDNIHELVTVSKRLRGRVVSAYMRLLNLLAQSETSLDVAFCEPHVLHIRRFDLPLARARRILPAMQSAGQTAVEENRETLVGILNAANRRTGTFEIDLGEDGTISGKALQATILAGSVIGQRQSFSLLEVVSTDPLTGHTASSWLLEKIAPVQIFNQDERLSRVIKVKEFDVLDAEPPEAEALEEADPKGVAPSPIDAQVDELLALEAGWYEAGTPALDKEGLERLRRFLHALLDGGALPRPYLYPTPDAGARAEWSLGGWDVSAAFDICSDVVDLHAAELDGDGLVEERVSIGDPSAIETLRAFVGRFISQRST